MQRAKIEENRTKEKKGRPANNKDFGFNLSKVTF